MTAKRFLGKAGGHELPLNAQVPVEQYRQKTVRVHPDLLERMSYWANRRGVSMQTYMADALEEAVRRENLDYDLPTLEIARLNELIDRVTSLESVIKNLAQINISMADTVTALTRGDGPNGPLGDEDEGELY